MATERYYCAICGASAVSGPGLVCPLHLRTSEQQLLAEQEREPSTWVLGVQDEAAVRPPPAAKREAEPPTEAADLVLAGFWQRFFAFLIDASAAMAIAGFLAVLTSANPPAAAILGLAGWWGYFLLSNGLGQLAGKATFGIKVIDPVTGREPGLAKGGLRTVGQAVTIFLTFGFGFLMMIGDRRKMTIHDYMAGTIVVRTTGVRR